MAGVALITGPQDPSQIDNLINSLITSINGYVLGASALAQKVSAASTTGTTIAAFGLTTLTTTKTTDTYKLASPTVGVMATLFASKSTTTGSAGMVVSMASTLVTLSTTIKKIIFKTKNQALTLIGLTSTSWGIVSNVGTVLTS